MKYATILMVLLAAAAHGQMEKRALELYRLEAFRKRSPAVGKKMLDLRLRDLDGKKVKLAGPHSKPLVIIGGAFT